MHRPSAETVHASPGDDADTAIAADDGPSCWSVAVVVVAVVADVVVVNVDGADEGATVEGARVSAHTVNVCRDTDESENHRISSPAATEAP